MDTKTRAEIVRFYRDEFKQQRRARAGRAPPPQLTPQEERDRNTLRMIRTRDRSRPRIRPGDSQEQQNATRAAQRRHEQDPGRRGGFQLGEDLRAIRGDRLRSMGPEAREAVVRRRNVTGNVQTHYHPGVSRPDPLQRNWTTRTFTPSERVNQIGVASRRHGVSAGHAPPAPGEPGHAAYVRRFQEGNRRISRQRRLEGMGVPSGAARRLAGR